MTPSIPLLAHGTPTLVIPASTAAVRVPRSAFQPCNSLTRELEQHDFLCVLGIQCTDTFTELQSATFAHVMIVRCDILPYPVFMLYALYIYK